MDIERCLIVTDALNCQKKTVEIIVNGDGDYLFDVKGKQRNLETEICGYFQDDSLRKNIDCETKTAKNRDRIENRTIQCFVLQN